MNIRGIITFSILLLCIKINAQTDFCIIAGNTIDKQTNLEIDKVEISILKLNKTFKSSKSGLFKFALPKGTYELYIEHPEYISKYVTITLNVDTLIQIRLQAKIKQTLVEEVEVIADRKVDIEKNMQGMTKMTSTNIQNIPLIGGEKDIVKGLQTLPGVQQSFEGSSDIIVRGGSPDQNLYLFDNVRLYNTNHAFGLLSSYNPYIVKSVDFYRGGFPAHYGGFISSILNVKSKNLIPNKYDGSIELGIISASLNLTLPIDSNSGAIFSIRRSFYDIATFFSDNSERFPQHFADYSFKYNYKKNKHSIASGLFITKDKMSFFYSKSKNDTLGYKDSQS